LCSRKEPRPNLYPFLIKRYHFKSNIQRRSYSHLAKDVSKESNSVNSSNSISVIPIVVYPNAFLNKSIILKDNKNKVGIYRWVNKENGNTYIGSSVNLGRRLRVYYDFSFLSVRVQKSKSRIYSAILKYGYSNFQLEILEYCTKEKAVDREQYYIDLFKPEYNLNSTAGSRLGSNHSEETKRKMSKSAQGRKLTEQTKNLLSLASKGINNPNFGRKHSAETKALISLARLGKSILSESIKNKMSVDSGTAVRVLDLNTNEISVYTSITRAAEGMGVTQPSLSKRLKETQGSITVKKRFQVEKVNENTEK
jgi:group I intron endonuclease